MSGFWAAADRVRSGAAGEAVPPPVSRFEIEGSGTEGFAAEEGAVLPSHRDEPARPAPTAVVAAGAPAPILADPPPAPSPTSLPPPAAAHAAVPEPVEERQAPTTSVIRETMIERSLHIAHEHRIVADVMSPSSDAPPVARPVPQDLSIAAPQDGRDARDVPASGDAPVIERVPVVAALPTIDHSPPPPTAWQPAVPPPPVSDPAPAPPLHVHIGRIDIRLDAPGPPASLPAVRRSPAPVDLNDYLARRGR